jgi:hypothetical protein
VNKPGVWWIACLMVGLVLVLSWEACSDKGDTAPVAPPPPGLTATPAAVSEGPGLSANVLISGGTPPYEILAQPDTSLASASLQNPGANPATLVVTAVSVASPSGSTSVKVADNSPSPRKEVIVQITKLP